MISFDAWTSGYQNMFYATINYFSVTVPTRLSQKCQRITQIPTCYAESLVPTCMGGTRIGLGCRRSEPPCSCSWLLAPARAPALLSTLLCLLLPPPPPPPAPPSPSSLPCSGERREEAHEPPRCAQWTGSARHGVSRRERGVSAGTIINSARTNMSVRFCRYD